MINLLIVLWVFAVFGLGLLAVVLASNMIHNELERRGIDLLELMDQILTKEVND